MASMLVDIATIYYRAYYSMPETMVAADGTPVNALRGSLDSLAHLVERYQPRRLAICWDLDWRPDWRVEQIESYKTARVAAEDEEQMPDTLSDQVDLLRSVLTEWGVQCIGVEGYEADDVVAHYSRNAPAPVWVVSGDRDLFQLVDDEREVSMLYIGTGVAKHTRADDSYIQERYGIPANRYGEFSVLRGDASDGLPGVKGIGEKTAAALIRQFGDLDQVMEAAHAGHPDLKPRICASLVEHADYVKRARDVVILHRSLEVEPLTEQWLQPTPSQTLAALGLERYQRAWEHITEEIR